MSALDAASAGTIPAVHTSLPNPPPQGGTGFAFDTEDASLAAALTRAFPPCGGEVERGVRLRAPHLIPSGPELQS